MAVNPLRNVRQAIRAHLLDDLRDVIDPAKVAWENQKFDPPQPSQFNTLIEPYWIRETCQIVLEHDPALSLHEMIGRTVFDVFYPIGKGTEVVEDITQAIANSFEKKAWVSNEGVVVGITKVERDPGIQADDVWWMASVSIIWRVYTPSTPIDTKFN